MSHKANPNYSTVVFCTLQFQGIHNWPGCPFDEVKYLRDLHRHVFHIKAYKEVFHNDRDVEFIMLKNAITRYIDERFPDHVMGAMSCEMLAEELIEKFGLSQCEVNEDGENGAIVTVKQPKGVDLGPYFNLEKYGIDTSKLTGTAQSVTGAVTAATAGAIDALTSPGAAQSISSAISAAAVTLKEAFKSTDSGPPHV